MSVTTPVSVSPSCNPWGCQEYKFLSFAMSVTTPVSVSPFTQSAGMSRGLTSVFCFVNHPKLSAICLATPRKSKSTDADIHEQTLVLVLQGTSITGVQNLSDTARLVQNYSQQLHPVPVKVSSTVSPSTPILNCPDITIMVHWLLKTKFVDDVEYDVLRCRVDILGTNCDQCVCMVQCCFTSTDCRNHKTH